MLLGILLMVLAGMGWVGIGAVVSHCAAKKVNLALVQLGQTVLCLAVGIAVMLFQEPELCSGRTRLLAFGVLFLAGVGNFSAFELMNRAMRVGPNGVVWALAQSALIFPFLFGVIFYGKTEGWPIQKGWQNFRRTREFPNRRRPRTSAKPTAPRQSAAATAGRWFRLGRSTPLRCGRWKRV